jgi:thymidine phosphorylase
MKAEAIGRASNVLGAGRNTLDESVDHAVGLIICVKRGDRVSAGQCLMELHHRGGRGVEQALALCRDAIAIGDAPPPRRRPILGDVR